MLLFLFQGVGEDDDLPDFDTLITPTGRRMSVVAENRAIAVGVENRAATTGAEL